jgi:hypothetical protein
VTETDQPRPDLDAAVDAVLPSLTAVSDDAAAASLRRTRVALADAVPARGGAGPWRWAAPTAVLTVVLLGVAMWWPMPPPDVSPRVVVNTPEKVPAPAPVPPSPARATVGPPVSAPRRIVPTRMARNARVAATSVAPAVAPVAPRQDPLVALIRAVQQIPEDAWQRSVERAGTPVIIPDDPLAPLDIVPLDTPPLGDQTSEPVAPGEP